MSTHEEAQNGRDKQPNYERPALIFGASQRSKEELKNYFSSEREPRLNHFKKWLKETGQDL